MGYYDDDDDARLALHSLKKITTIFSKQQKAKANNSNLVQKSTADGPTSKLDFNIIISERSSSSCHCS